MSSAQNTEILSEAVQATEMSSKDFCDYLAMSLSSDNRLEALFMATSVHNPSTDIQSKASAVMWVRRAKQGEIPDDEVENARKNFEEVCRVMQRTEGTASSETVIKLFSEVRTRNCFDAALELAKDIDNQQDEDVYEDDEGTEEDAGTT